MSKKRRKPAPERSRQQQPAGQAPPDQAPEVKAGRPPGPELKPGQLDKMLEALRWGNYRDDAAEYAGIKLRSMYRWCALGKKGDEAYVGFWQAVLNAEQTAKINAVRDFYQAGQRDPKWLLQWLSRKFPEQWGSNNRVIAELLRRVAELEKDGTHGYHSPPVPGDSRGNGDGHAAATPVPPG